MNYSQTLEQLYSMMPDFQKVGAEAYKPGLERVEEFDRHLGMPSTKFKVIHVAGTNGKGSVSHMLASILQRSGLRVGLYTSPHLKEFRERIRVNGEMISERGVVDFSQQQMDVMERLELSFFEATVGMAFDWFVRSGVEVAVVEVGLGGRLDATNIVNPMVSVVTNIGLEHTYLLGDTVEEIAAEKGGVIKQGGCVVIGERDSRTAPVFSKIAKHRGAKLLFAEDMFRVVEVDTGGNGVSRQMVERLSDSTTKRYELDLMGEYQRFNLITVLATVEALRSCGGIKIDQQSVLRGLATAAATTGLKGRWQVIGNAPLVVCDTGHNESGIRAVVEQIEHQRYDRLYMVFGVANDKTLDNILPLLPTKAHYIFTQASMNRARSAQELYREAKRYGLEGEVVMSVSAAIERARELASPQDMIFVGGSSFVVAEADI